jgi:hypothetical protein
MSEETSEIIIKYTKLIGEIIEGNYTDTKKVGEVVEVRNEINRRLKILDEVIEKDNIKHQDNCLFGLRVRDLLRKENLL